MQIPQKVIVPIITALIGSAATYFVMDSAHRKSVDELKTQMAELEKKSREAVLTQRISEQMEDIAFQQRAVSEVQRERAEEQSRIADMERGKAEIERGLALKAQEKAVESAKEATRQAEIAESQTVLAMNNLLAAEEARAHADTLFYLARANSLAQTSVSMSAKGNTDLSRLLSYAAWRYTNEYGGDIYQQDLFASLLAASEHTKRYNMSLKGGIRQISLAKSDTRTYVFGATDYGEVFVYGTRTSRSVKLNNDLRGISAIDTTKAIVLGVNGMVYDMDIMADDKVSGKALNNHVRKTLSLPEGRWTRLVTTQDKSTIIAMSDNTIAWIDVPTLQTKSIAKIEGKASSIGLEGNRLHVFADNSKHFYADEPGKLKDAHMSSVSQRVTAYCYDPTLKMHVLGLSNGFVELIDNNGVIIKELNGHLGGITHLAVHENLLVTASYDRTMKLWNLRELNSVLMPYEQKLEKWPLTFEINPKSSKIWIGTDGGELVNSVMSVYANAETTRKMLTREFTPEEWNYYMGTSVPYKSILK